MRERVRREEKGNERRRERGERIRCAARRKNSRIITNFSPPSASSVLRRRDGIFDRVTITKTRKDPPGERIRLSQSSRGSARARDVEKRETYFDGEMRQKRPRAAARQLVKKRRLP